MSILRRALLVTVTICSLSMLTELAHAITEDMDEISLRDAGASKQRPYNPDYDFDEGQQAEIE